MKITTTFFLTTLLLLFSNTVFCNPIYFDSFQVTRNESGTTTEGVLFLDDLRIVDPFTVAFDIIDADGSEVITINGAQHDAGVTDFELFPGEYQFTVAKTGYQTYSGSFGVEEDDLIIEVVLTPSVDGQMPGDANCDGLVNVLDVIVIPNYFAGNEPDPFCFENADVNGDGAINVMDIILTIEIFLGNDTGYGTVTDVDGNVYQTVIIGNQEWMAENLRVTRYINQDDILTGISDEEWHSITEGAYAIYPHAGIDGIESDEEMVAAYGNLYNWHAVNDSRGLCPEGWAVPGDLDWTQLVNYLMDEYDLHNNWQSTDINAVGNALKSCRQINSPEGGDCDTSVHPRWDANPTHHGFDQFGFSALPGGARWSSSTFYAIGYYGLWWSASEYKSVAWTRSMISYDGSLRRNTHYRTDGFSVRCFREVTEEPTLYNLPLEVHPENTEILLDKRNLEE